MTADVPVTTARDRVPRRRFDGPRDHLRAAAAGRPVDGGIRTTNRTAEKAAELAGLEGVTAYATETDAAANLAAVAGAKLVVVAVKPAMVPDLLREIADALEPGTVVVSVAAGVTVATFESLLPESVAVIRSMPNTPAVVGRAVTGVSAGTRSSEADLALAVSLFETVGEVLVVPEEQIDALSTISGSGPAYVFHLIEQLTATAIDKGFTPEQAARHGAGHVPRRERAARGIRRGPRRAAPTGHEPQGHDRAGDRRARGGAPQARCSTGRPMPRSPAPASSPQAPDTEPAQRTRSSSTSTS